MEEERSRKLKSLESVTTHRDCTPHLIKTAYVNKTNTVAPVKNADGAQLFTDMHERNIRQMERAFSPTAESRRQRGH